MLTSQGSPPVLKPQILSQSTEYAKYRNEKHLCPKITSVFKNTNHRQQKTLGNGYNRERKDKRIGKNKEIKIKNKEPEIKRNHGSFNQKEKMLNIKMTKVVIA